jgi:predicted nucleic acid-binding protein
LATSASPPEPTVCDTTALRHFAIISQFDLLVRTLGGTVRTPRQVFDDEDDVDTPGVLVSELGASERYYRSRSVRDPEATDKWSRLRSLRQRNDIEILDLSNENGEESTYAELTSAGLARRYGLAAPLGPGEAAVIAIATHRRMRAAIDEHAGRSILHDRSPGHSVVTTRDLVRAAAANGFIESPEAEIIYTDMLAEGYRGPQSLWLQPESSVETRHHY